MSTHRQPWPEYGGELTTVQSLSEWESCLSTADAKNKVLVVDCYATWCPPCKTAAPVYARMSEMFTQESCVFAKVNVDQARDVAQALKVTSMCVLLPSHLSLLGEPALRCAVISRASNHLASCRLIDLLPPIPRPCPVSSLSHYSSLWVQAHIQNLPIKERGRCCCGISWRS